MESSPDSTGDGQNPPGSTGKPEKNHVHAQAGMAVNLPLARKKARPGCTGPSVLCHMAHFSILKSEVTLHVVQRAPSQK